jgi:hypothetical protein
MILHYADFILKYLEYIEDIHCAYPLELLDLRFIRCVGSICHQYSLLHIIFPRCNLSFVLHLLYNLKEIYLCCVSKYMALLIYFKYFVNMIM